MKKLPNSQYNIAAPDSLPIKIVTFQRKRMYDRFIETSGIKPDDTLLDVGVTSDRSYACSNYLEAWYPHKARITAVGLDDSAFLQSLYPGLTFVRADGLNLPFDNRSFDMVHSSAVLEHVGSFANQVRFVAECARVARKAVFLTTPNRWFPIEFHTCLPLVHWLSKPTFRSLMCYTGREFFADEANLNLMSSAELRKAARAALPIGAFLFEVAPVLLAGWPSNLLLIARRIRQEL
jgi:Methyltransferase domain